MWLVSLRDLQFRARRFVIAILVTSLVFGIALAIDGMRRSVEDESPAIVALFGAPVTVPSPAEYVALGAARQAAWVLRGGDEPPAWPVEGVDVAGEPTPAVRERYADVRDAARALLT